MRITFPDRNSFHRSVLVVTLLVENWKKEREKERLSATSFTSFLLVRWSNQRDAGSRMSSAWFYLVWKSSFWRVVLNNVEEFIRLHGKIRQSTLHEKTCVFGEKKKKRKTHILELWKKEHTWKREKNSNSLLPIATSPDNLFIDNLKVEKVSIAVIYL